MCSIDAAGLEQDDPAILLYYKYVDVPETASLAEWYRASCAKLTGRVRVAPDGVNATLGGNAGDLQAHVDALVAHDVIRGVDIDFKFARDTGPLSPAVLRESKLDRLTVTVCKEVVSLGPRAAAAFGGRDAATLAGRHVSPQEFHDLILHPPAHGLVLVDARNLYETRVGRFEAPDSVVPTIDPRTRCFSDLPAWLDAHAEQLRGKTVAMYCTGGVRCERASALVRARGEGFADVVQLRGGVQRYLEEFPDGLFRGQNFVFDGRGAVPAEPLRPLGVCAVCDADAGGAAGYAARVRCTRCRMLVLCCDACARAESDRRRAVTCELCRGGGGRPVSRRLRVLCLHGFRQTASGLRGRTHALAKKLRDVAELDFVDAPHHLPVFMRASTRAGAAERAGDSPPRSSGNGAGHGPAPRRAWLRSRADAEAFAKHGPAPVPAPARTEGAAQLLEQTEGWAESVRVLEEALAAGPAYDGVLGFSQGGGVAAALAAASRGGTAPLRFCICASGYLPGCAEVRRAVGGSGSGGVDVPSLHLYGSNDRQVPREMSEELMGAFRPDCVTSYVHSKGHIIPADAATLRRVTAFLRQFLPADGDADECG
ncbi:unnamed protein product [Pedinophyceae sp. YPF-701]|nr:unnamed protein product [Pedinophyceae sp. YPF-701]